MSRPISTTVPGNVKPACHPELVFDVVNWWENYRPRAEAYAAGQRASTFDQHRENMRMISEQHALIAKQFGDGASVNSLATAYGMTPGQVRRILNGRGYDL